jgi:hypothetical protein
VSTPKNEVFQLFSLLQVGFGGFGVDSHSRAAIMCPFF